MTLSFVTIVTRGLGGFRKKPYLCAPKRKKHETTMNSKLLKLDAPYQVIYAGGKIGRHIATVMTWEDDADGEASIVNAKQYPVIDQGGEFASGTLVWEAELDDCRVICPINKEGQPATNLYWFANMVEFDLKQELPAGADYMFERLEALGCKIALPMEDDHVKTNFKVTLDIFSPQGSWEENRLYRVKSNKYDGFYFEAFGSEEDIYNDLHYQRTCYKEMFHDEFIDIEFTTNDMELDDVIERLNNQI